MGSARASRVMKILPVPGLSGIVYSPVQMHLSFLLGMGLSDTFHSKACSGSIL
jgi:hypothetical protein